MLRGHGVRELTGRRKRDHMNRQTFGRQWNRYSTAGSADRNRVDRIAGRATELFRDTRLRDFVFEPFRGVFNLDGEGADRDIRTVITTVAIANAVLAGLPGKLGVGVIVCIALEAYMGYRIARRIGIEMKRPSDVLKYFGLFGGIGVTILWAIRVLLGIGFSLFSVVPFVNPLILAELFVTDIVGVIFWVGFVEARDEGSFRFPNRMISRLWEQTMALFRHQVKFARALLKPSNLMTAGHRLRAWISGDVALDRAHLRGEVFATLALGMLIEGRGQAFDCPIGRTFLDSVRRTYPTQLGDASTKEIGGFFAGRTPEQLTGDVRLIKGEMFEHLVEIHENADGDPWTAELHESRNVPGSDITFTHEATGEQVTVSLKATEDPALIEHALERYPETPILTTDEIRQHFGDDHPMVRYADVEDADLEEMTDEQLRIAMEELEPVSGASAAATSVAAVSVARLWPFVVARMRSRISEAQFDEALGRVLGTGGTQLASRLGWAVLLGPVFAWYLLARGVTLCVQAVEESQRPVRVLK